MGQVSKAPKALNCGIGDDRIEHVLWCALNLPVFSSLKNVVVLCRTNNLLLDSPKDIADGIPEIARSFKTNYSCVNAIIFGILPRDDSWSVNRVSIKKVNQILKLKCYESSCTFVSYDSGWSLANGFLNADLYYSDRLHLVEKGNLKLAESIFNSIEVPNDFICRNHNNKFSKSYKMAVSFKLNNTDFPPLLFPSVSKPVSSISASLPFITVCKPFPRNINTRLFTIATNTPISSVPRILQDNCFPKFIMNPSRSPISNLACNIPIKDIQRSICKSVQSFQPVVVNVNVVSVPVCHRLRVVKSVFRHQHVSCLAKPIFLTVNTVTDTLNVCNVIKCDSSTHNVRKAFPTTHNFISIPRQVYCPENNNNIANSHLPLTNLLSSSEIKSSTSSLTSNLNFSECTFSLPEISCSRIYHHVSSSLKFSLFL